MVSGEMLGFISFNPNYRALVGIKHSKLLPQPHHASDNEFSAAHYDLLTVLSVK